MRANNDVTEALRRTIGLMQGELERSVLSTQMLGTSSLRYGQLEAYTFYRYIHLDAALNIHDIRYSGQRPHDVKAINHCS